jgi:hypothetical protein
MADEYQFGSDQEWLVHSNKELADTLKKRNRQIARLRLLLTIMIVALGFVAWRFHQRIGITELWNF